MINKNDKRNIFIIVLVLLVIFGVLAVTRGFKDKDKDSEKPDINEPTVVDPTDKDDQGQSSDDSDYYGSNDTTVVHVVNEVKEHPVISIDISYHFIEVGSEFLLPTVESLDDNGNSLDVMITYMFQPIGSDEYYEVDTIDTSVLGKYKITYSVTNSYDLTTERDVYVDVSDTTAPVIEAVIEECDAVEDITEYIPVNNNDIINKEVKFQFSDNFDLSYVEYYKAKYEWTVEGKTLEEEGMQEIIEVNLEEEFSLYEDGEYHIRAYDSSGNASEFIVVIDTTTPSVTVEYEQISNDEVLVTITGDKDLKEVEGFTVSEDGKILTRIYSTSILEDIIISDIAGNEITVSLSFEKTTFVLTQDDEVITDIDGKQLNTYDGDIKVEVTGDNVSSVVYSIDDGLEANYNNGDLLETDDNYRFTVTANDYVDVIEFSISSVAPTN